MKILITTDWYYPEINGVVASVINLEKELRNMGHEVKILTLSGDYISKYIDNVYYIKSFNLNRIYPNARASIFIKNQFIQEIIKWKPDIIHSQCEFTTYIYARKISKLLNRPVVHTYHTIYEDYTHYISPNRTIGKKAVAAISKKLLNSVDAVIAPTKKVQQILQGYGVETSIYTIPTGINLSKFMNAISNIKKSIMKKELGIPEDHFVLISVGRLAKEKNIDEIIQYFKMINKEKISLLIVGDGPYRSKLEQDVRSFNLTDKIIFTGMISPEHVPDYYKLGDVFISASNSETQGLTYLEALASGLPAVCKKDLCIEGVVIDKHNGFQYDSFEGFWNGIEFMLSDKENYDHLSKNAISTAKEYSTREFANKVEHLYKEIIEQAEINSDAV